MNKQPDTATISLSRFGRDDGGTRRKRHKKRRSERDEQITESTKLPRE